MVERTGEEPSWTISALGLKQQPHKVDRLQGVLDEKNVKMVLELIVKPTP